MKRLKSTDLRTKVVYILSDLDYSLSFEWIAQKIDQQRFEVIFVMIQQENVTTTIEQVLKSANIETRRLIIPHKLNRLSAFFKTLRLIRHIQPQVVHCHMRRANLLGLSASWLARVPKRIYTRHYSTQNHRYYPNAVFTDRVLNALATKIIAPSKKVEETLLELEKVSPLKVELIHHGFDLSYFDKRNEEAITKMKSALDIDSKSPVVGGIARYLELKGWQYIIPAFQEFLRHAPNAVLLIANGYGPYKQNVSEMLEELPEDSFREIHFEKDLATLYHCMDFFIHAPIDLQIEAFGQIYVEALASGVPSVFTLSGVAHEFIKHEENALVVTHCNSSELSRALYRLHTEKELSEKLSSNGKRAVRQFDFLTFLKQTEKLYV